VILGQPLYIYIYISWKIHVWSKTLS